ncbi:hypothetical protein DSO57_1008172 [Entomophthora muscae]|uniref:Uncharacterized protein n=1 Tax=Entomophthora muscae TaxID=34485 RepID=A0ACC2T787_9FUNG|nr:hypothetical protein DSO57_1008172 [Entomophthora muscae]
MPHKLLWSAHTAQLQESPDDVYEVWGADSVVLVVLGLPAATPETEMEGKVGQISKAVHLQAWPCFLDLTPAKFWPWFS